jgi:protein CpxP
MTTALSRLLLNRSTVLAFIAGAGLSAGVVALAAQGGGMAALHHGMAMSGDHVDHMLKHLYVEIDATDAQKAQIDPLVKQAMSDLSPLHARAQSAHTQFFEALTSADRDSLEAAREAHIQLADQASKRIVQLIADVDGVLTPTQRQALATHLQKLHGMPGS